jgi:hypothetical protein
MTIQAATAMAKSNAIAATTNGINSFTLRKPKAFRRPAHLPRDASFIRGLAPSAKLMPMAEPPMAVITGPEREKSGAEVMMAPVMTAPEVGPETNEAGTKIAPAVDLIH